MNDRELLELAAKAAGIDAAWHTDYVNEAEYEGMWLKGERSPDNSKYWNPLTNDGDALRLAVKLGLAIYPAGNSTGCAPEDEETGQHVMHNGDPYAATRRAIVRAAAKIGQAQGAEPSTSTGGEG